MAKIRSEVIKRTGISTVMKIINNSTSINSTFMKIEILAVSNLLNNFQLIKKVDLLWAKWPKYALKFLNGKKNSGIGIIMKYINNFVSINHTFWKLSYKSFWTCWITLLKFYLSFHLNKNVSWKLFNKKKKSIYYVAQ